MRRRPAASASSASPWILASRLVSPLICSCSWVVSAERSASLSRTIALAAVRRSRRASTRRVMAPAAMPLARLEDHLLGLAFAGGHVGVEPVELAVEPAQDLVDLDDVGFGDRPVAAAALVGAEVPPVKAVVADAFDAPFDLSLQAAVATARTARRQTIGARRDFTGGSTWASASRRRRSAPRRRRRCGWPRSAWRGGSRGLPPRPCRWPGRRRCGPSG